MTLLPGAFCIMMRMFGTQVSVCKPHLGCIHVAIVACVTAVLHLLVVCQEGYEDGSFVWVSFRFIWILVSYLVISVFEPLAAFYFLTVLFVKILGPNVCITHHHRVWWAEKKSKLLLNKSEAGLQRILMVCYPVGR